MKITKIAKKKKKVWIPIKDMEIGTTFEGKRTGLLFLKYGDSQQDVICLHEIKENGGCNYGFGWNPDSKVHLGHVVDIVHITYRG